MSVTIPVTLGAGRSRRHRDSSEPVRLSVGARRDTLDPLEGRVEALGVCEACFSRNGGDRERRVPKQATRRLHSTADDFLVNASAQGGPEPLFQRSTRAVRGRLGRGVQSGRGHGGYGLHRSRAWARVPRAPSCPSRRVASKIQHLTFAGSSATRHLSSAGNPTFCAVFSIVFARVPCLHGREEGSCACKT